MSQTSQSTEPKRGGEWKSSAQVLGPMLEEIKGKVAEKIRKVEAGIESWPDGVGPDCSLCGDTGWRQMEVTGPRGTYNASKRCECRHEPMIRFQLPSRYHAAQLADFTDTLQAIIGAWLQEPGDGLFLYGAAGTGKTHLAAAIVRDQIIRGQSIRFRRAAQLFQVIRESYGNDSVSEAEALAAFTDPRMLVLDDLGTGSLSDHERRYTLEVLDSRLNANRPTIITSNWDLEQIRQGFDERIASRLATFKRLNFDGQDRRKGRKSA